MSHPAWSEKGILGAGVRKTSRVVLILPTGPALSAEVGIPPLTATEGRWITSHVHSPCSLAPEKEYLPDSTSRTLQPFSCRRKVTPSDSPAGLPLSDTLLPGT